jgi:predicted nucleotidyltransferase
MIQKKEQMALKRFKTLLLEQFGKEIVGIRLFGSKARGDAHAHSDIDVLVVIREDDWHMKEAIGKIATTILIDEGIYLSVKVMGRQTYQRLMALKSPFLINIRREGVRL